MAQVEATGTVSSDPGKWWLVALLGVLSIAAGVLAIDYPDITLLVLGPAPLESRRDRARTVAG